MPVAVLSVRGLTSWVPVEHPSEVLTFGRRFSAAALSLALLAGDVAQCAGWAATPEARMACCADEATCPMHRSAEQTDVDRVVTQAQADSCCAASEPDRTDQSTPTFAATISSAVLGTATALPATLPVLVLRGAWQVAVPLPPDSVPKHVRLSVFLV